MTPPLAIATGTALLIFLLWLTPFGRWDARGASDFEAFYAPVARNLIDGAGLVAAGGEPAVRYPPGFPVVVAALFTAARLSGIPEDVWLRGFTVLALALGTALLYDLARLVLGPRRALIAAMLWATCPFHLWFALQPNSEVPFFPLFFGALWLLQRARAASPWRTWLVASAGILVGCAALVRPIALFLPMMLSLIYVVHDRSEGFRAFGRAVLLLACAAAVLTPWEIAAFRMTGRWIPLSTGGPEALREGLNFAAPSKGHQLVIDVPPDIAAIADAVVAAHGAGRLATTPEIAALLLEQARERPGAMLRLYGWKAARAWYGTDALRQSELYAMILQLAYLGLSVIGMVLLYREGGSARVWVATVAALVCYFWAMTIISLSILRYMTPVMPLLFTGAAVALSEVHLRCAGAVRAGRRQWAW